MKFGSVIIVNSPSEHPETKNLPYLDIAILFTQASRATFNMIGFPLDGFYIKGRLLIMT